MTLSRNWKFTLSDDDEQAVVIKKARDNMLKDVTFLQLCKSKGVVVMKNRVRASAVRKMFSVLKIHPFSSVKEVCHAMVNVTFTYGTLLSKHQKKLANKAANYVDAVQNYTQKAPAPEEHPEFENVYNIIASADTVEQGMLKVLDDLPNCSNLISCAVRRYRLSDIQNIH
jgi:hypothetical protein